MKIIEENKEAYLAVDTAYEIGMVVLLSKEKVLFEEELPKKNAHGQAICQALENAIKSSCKNGHRLAGALVGLGPGSFVGVRIAVSTLLGYCFAKGLPLRGFCSHRALLDSIFFKTDATNLYVFMKASKDLGYFTEYAHDIYGMTQVAPTKVTSSTDFLKIVRKKSVVITDMPKELKNHVADTLLMEPMFGPKSRGIWKAALGSMESNFLDQSAFLRPNYVKPPSVSLPQAIR